MNNRHLLFINYLVIQDPYLKWKFRIYKLMWACLTPDPLNFDESGSSYNKDFCWLNSAFPSFHTSGYGSAFRIRNHGPN